MSAILLHGNEQNGHTLIPNLFLDEYMPTANGEYVKIYLYLLRCLTCDTQELSVSVIADKFDHTENDVRRALKYWEKMNLLKLEYDSSKALTGIYLLNGEKKDMVTDDVPARKISGEPSPRSPLTQEEIQQLLFICEQYLGKTLSSSEVSRILYFHDALGFSADLIEYLVEYCVSKRHKNLRYIETVALSWYQEGYTTVAQAKRQTNTYNKAYFSILKAFGITNRNPVDIEISYMNKWLKEYGFSLELILEACSRTMAAIHQPGFEYADKILKNWQKNGVTVSSDLKALDNEHHSSRSKSETSLPRKISSANRFHNFREREYDFNELEKKLINN